MRDISILTFKYAGVDRGNCDSAAATDRPLHFPGSKLIVVIK